VTRLTPSEAVALVFGGLGARLETESGDELALQATGIKATRVWATAPRLQVSVGMTLRGRLVSPHDERPWVATFEVEDAQFHSNELARVRMRAVSVGLDETRRRSVRVPTGGVAWLTAVNCQDVVDGDRVDGTLVDLSQTGLAFATGRVLRTGDRLVLHARFFADEVNAEVRVMSTRPGQRGRTIAGCTFIEIDAANRARVDRLIAAADGSPDRREPGLDMGALREAVNGPAQPDTGGWRGLFRR
jgi:hypothetical protein